MSLDPSEFGTADIEIAAVHHLKNQTPIKIKKKKIPVKEESYTPPDYFGTNYGLGYPKRKQFDIRL